MKVCTERPRDGTGYRTLEDDIIAALPSTMKANGQVCINWTANTGTGY